MKKKLTGVLKTDFCVSRGTLWAKKFLVKKLVIYIFLRIPSETFPAGNLKADFYVSTGTFWTKFFSKEKQLFIIHFVLRAKIFWQVFSKLISMSPEEKRTKTFEKFFNEKIHKYIIFYHLERQAFEWCPKLF